MKKEKVTMILILRWARDGPEIQNSKRGMSEHASKSTDGEKNDLTFVMSNVILVSLLSKV